MPAAAPRQPTSAEARLIAEAIAAGGHFNARRWPEYVAGGGPLPITPPGTFCRSECPEASPELLAEVEAAVSRWAAFRHRVEAGDLRAVAEAVTGANLAKAA